MTLQSLDTLRDETVGNLDLILKWFTVRFLDTNPSMLNKALEYLRLVLTMLVDMDYSLHEYEATSFIPYLIIKVSRPGALSIYVASPATSPQRLLMLPKSPVRDPLSINSNTDNAGETGEMERVQDLHL